MSAAQDPKKHALRAPIPGAVPPSGGESDAQSALSALADGELGAIELNALLENGLDLDAMQSSWNGYHLIGESLRGGVPAVSLVAPSDFLLSVRARLRSETEALRPPAPVSVPVQVHLPAANDAVFRWKLVAGAASLAAVMAVSWSVLSNAPTPVGSPAGAQLASMDRIPVAPNSLPEAVVVNTPQGQVIRDARLEALLSEHRHFGGMSALQMPAGFLRDATYDAAAQR